MLERDWLIIANAIAGFYAASIWGYFAWGYAVVHRWGLAAANLSAGIAAALIGLAYVLGTRTGAPPPWIRWMVIPVLAIPASITFASWVRTRRFIADTPGDA